jgi:hypothetical protein
MLRKGARAMETSVRGTDLIRKGFHQEVITEDED